MDELSTIPNGKALLETLMLTPEMLRSLQKVPVPVPALRALLGLLIAALPFDEEFYARTYPDLAEARESGAIADLGKHFREHGYLEGRLGAQPAIDENFYKESYPDVAMAISRGDIRSALDHYITAGAAEGRAANPTEMRARRAWLEILGR